MSNDQIQYRVVRGPIQARFVSPIVMPGGGLVGGGHYYAGQILPPIEDAQRDHLLAVGMIEPIPQPATESGPEQADPTPAPSAPEPATAG